MSMQSRLNHSKNELVTYFAQTNVLIVSDLFAFCT